MSLCSCVQVRPAAHKASFKRKMMQVWRMYLAPEVRTWPFLLYLFSNIIFSFWITFPQTYLVDAARHHGQSPMQAAFLPATIGVASIVGNLVCGLASTRLPCLLIDSACIALLGSSLLLLQSVLQHHARSVAVCAFYGAFYGSRYALLMENIVYLLGVENAKAGLGLFQLSGFLAALPGIPVGGKRCPTRTRILLCSPPICGRFSLQASSLINWEVTCWPSRFLLPCL